MQTLGLVDYVKSQPGLIYSETPFSFVLRNLPPLNHNGPWLVGGTVRRFLSNEELTSDFDIMFKNVEQFENFCGQMREKGAEVKYESDANITFDYLGYEIQAIRAEFHNTLIQTLNNFDYTICQFGFDGMNLVWGD